MIHNMHCEHETTVDDEPVTVRYDYEAGEPERWNGLTGVGNPASGPIVVVYEIKRSDGVWRTVDPKEPWLERVEQEIIDVMIEREQDHYEGAEDGLKYDS